MLMGIDILCALGVPIEVMNNSNTFVNKLC